MDIQTYLKNSKVTKAAFGRRIGVTRGAVSNWVHGVATPSLKTAVKVEDETNGQVKPRDFINKEAS